METAEVFVQFLKPSTVDKQESYCSAYKDDPNCADHFAKATAYVSHAWGHEFLDVVAALEDFDSRQPTPTVFWFDIFSNNQHKSTTTTDFTWWETVFMSLVGSLKRTLLVLDWEDPKPLGRVWCLWDMVSTISTGSDFQVIMSPKNHTAFTT